MLQRYKWLQRVIPYHKSQLNIALPYDLIVELFASLNSTGMRINSPSRFNQGKYKVIANGNLVKIRGPFSKNVYGSRSSRFPLETQIIIQPTSSQNETSIYIESKPTIKALVPICFLGLSIPTFLLISGIFWDILSFDLLIILLLYPYAIIILFFNIEVKTLINVLQEQISTRKN
ncbi:hypothetical protein [Anabaena sp. CCY 0017]|uniref:hypothetical protein n=1 Tax=Anabaena sp. CCY 0017 TaxID=3103866 RepID=UPI0039C60E4A